MNTERVRNVSLVLLCLGMMCVGTQQASATVYCDDWYVGTTHVWECDVSYEGPFFAQPFDRLCRTEQPGEQACDDFAQQWCEQTAGTPLAWGWWSVFPQEFTEGWLGSC
jgi:hypothetical protein